MCIRLIDRAMFFRDYTTIFLIHILPLIINVFSHLNKRIDELVHENPANEPFLRNCKIITPWALSLISSHSDQKDQYIVAVRGFQLSQALISNYALFFPYTRHILNQNFLTNQNNSVKYWLVRSVNRTQAGFLISMEKYRSTSPEVIIRSIHLLFRLISLDSSFSSDTNNTQIAHLSLIIIGNIGLLLLDPLLHPETRAYNPADPAIYKQLQWSLHNWASRQALPLFLSLFVASLRSMIHLFDFHRMTNSAYARYAIKNQGAEDPRVDKPLKSVLRDFVLCEPSDDVIANSLPLSPPDSNCEKPAQSLVLLLMDILVDSLPDLLFCVAHGAKQQVIEGKKTIEKHRTTFERIYTMFDKFLSHQSRLSYIQRLQQGKQLSKSGKEDDTYRNSGIIHGRNSPVEPFFLNHIPTLIGILHLYVQYATRLPNQNFNFTKMAASIRSSLFSHPVILHTVSAVCMPSLLEATSICALKPQTLWSQCRVDQKNLSASTTLSLDMNPTQFQVYPGIQFFSALFTPNEIERSHVFVHNLIQCALPDLRLSKSMSKTWVGSLFLFNEILASGHAELFQPFLPDLLEIVISRPAIHNDYLLRNSANTPTPVKWLGITAFVMNLLFSLHKGKTIDKPTSKREEKTYFHSWTKYDFVWKNDFDTDFRYDIVNTDDDLKTALHWVSLIEGHLSVLTNTRAPLVVFERNLLTSLLLLLPVPHSLTLRLVEQYLWPISFSLAQPYLVTSDETQHPSNALYHTPALVVFDKPVDITSIVYTIFPTSAQLAHLAVVLSAEYLNLLFTSFPTTKLEQLFRYTSVDLVQSVFDRSKSNINFLTMFGKLGELGAAPQTVLPEFPSNLDRLSADTVAVTENLSLYLVLEYHKLTESARLDDHLDDLTREASKKVDPEEFNYSDKHQPIETKKPLHDYARQMKPNQAAWPNAPQQNILASDMEKHRLSQQIPVLPTGWKAETESGSRPMRVLLPIGEGIKTAQAILAGMTQDNLQHPERDRSVDTVKSDVILSEAYVFIQNCLAGFMGLTPPKSHTAILWMPPQPKKESSLRSFVPLDPDYHPIYPEPLPHSETAQLCAASSRQMVSIFNDAMDRYVEESAFRRYVIRKKEESSEPVSYTAPSPLIPALIPTFSKSTAMYEKEALALKEVLVSFFLAVSNPMTAKMMTTADLSIAVHFALLCLHVPFTSPQTSETELIPLYTHPFFTLQVGTHYDSFFAFSTFISSPVPPTVARQCHADIVDPYLFVDAFFSLAPFFPADKLDTIFLDLSRPVVGFVYLFQIFVRTLVTVLEESTHDYPMSDKGPTHLFSFISASFSNLSQNSQSFLKPQKDDLSFKSNGVYPFPHPKLTKSNIPVGYDGETVQNLHKEQFAEVRLTRELELHCSSTPVPPNIAASSKNPAIPGVCMDETVHERVWSPAITNIFDYILHKALSSCRSHCENDRAMALFALDVLVNECPWEYLLLHENRIVLTLLELTCHIDYGPTTTLNFNNQPIAAPFADASDYVIDEFGIPDVFDINSNVHPPAVLDPLTFHNSIDNRQKPFFPAANRVNIPESRAIYWLVRALVVRCHPAPLFPTTLNTAFKDKLTPETFVDNFGSGNLPHMIVLVALVETLVKFLPAQQRSTRSLSLNTLDVLATRWASSVDRMKPPQEQRSPIPSKDSKNAAMTALLSLPTLKTLHTIINLSDEPSPLLCIPSLPTEVVFDKNETSPQCPMDDFKEKLSDTTKDPLSIEHGVVKIECAILLFEHFPNKIEPTILPSMLHHLYKTLQLIGHSEIGMTIFRCLAIDQDMVSLITHPELKQLFENPFSETEVDQKLVQSTVAYFRKDFQIDIFESLFLLDKLILSPQINEEDKSSLLALVILLSSWINSFQFFFQSMTDQLQHCGYVQAMKALATIASLPLPISFRHALQNSAKSFLLSSITPSLRGNRAELSSPSLFTLSRHQILRIAIKHSLIKVTSQMQVHLYNSMVISLQESDLDRFTALTQVLCCIEDVSPMIVSALVDMGTSLLASSPHLFMQYPIFEPSDNTTDVTQPDQPHHLSLSQSCDDVGRYCPTSVFIQRFGTPPSSPMSHPAYLLNSIPVFAPYQAPFKLTYEASSNVFVESFFVDTLVQFANTFARSISDKLSLQRSDHQSNSFVHFLLQHPNATNLRQEVLVMMTNDYQSSDLPTDTKVDPTTLMIALMRLSNATDRQQQASYILNQEVMTSRSLVNRLDDGFLSQSQDISSQSSQPQTQPLSLASQGLSQGTRNESTPVSSQDSNSSQTDLFSSERKFFKLKDSFVAPLQKLKWLSDKSARHDQPRNDQLNFSSLCADTIVSSAVPSNSPYLSTITYTDIRISVDQDIHAGFLYKTGLILKMFTLSPDEVVKSTCLIKCINSLFLTFSEIYINSSFYLISVLSPAVLDALRQLPEILLHFLRRVSVAELKNDEDMNQAIVGAFQALASLVNLHSEVNFSYIIPFLCMEVPVTFNSAFRVHVLKKIFHLLSRPDPSRTLPLLKFVGIPIASALAEQKMKRLLSTEELNLLDELTSLPSDPHGNTPNSLIKHVRDNLIYRSKNFISQYEAGDNSEKDITGSIYHTLYWNIPLRETFFSFFSYLVRLLPAIAEQDKALPHLITKNNTRHPSFAGYQVILSESLALGFHHPDFMKSLKTLVVSEPPPHLLTQYLNFIPFSPSFFDKHSSSLLKSCLPQHRSDTILESFSLITIELKMQPSFVNSSFLTYFLTHYNKTASKNEINGGGGFTYECSWINDLQEIVDLLVETKSYEFMKTFFEAIPHSSIGLCLEPTIFDAFLTFLSERKTFKEEDTKETKEQVVEVRLLMISKFFSIFKMCHTLANVMLPSSKWGLMSPQPDGDGNKGLPTYVKDVRQSFFGNKNPGENRVLCAIQQFLHTVKLYHEIQPLTYTPSFLFEHEDIKRIANDLFSNSILHFGLHISVVNSFTLECSGGVQTLNLSFVLLTLMKILQEFLKYKQLDKVKNHVVEIFEHFRQTLKLNIPVDSMSEHIWELTTQMMKDVEARIHELQELRERLTDFAKATIQDVQRRAGNSEFVIQRPMYFICWVASLNASLWPEIDRTLSATISSIIIHSTAFSQDIAKYYFLAGIKMKDLTQEQSDQLIQQLRIHIKDGIKLPDPTKGDFKGENDPSFHHLSRMIEILCMHTSPLVNIHPRDLSESYIKFQFRRLELLYEAKKKDLDFHVLWGKRCNMNAYNDAVFRVYSVYLQMPCPEDFHKDSHSNGADIVSDDLDPRLAVTIISPLSYKAPTIQFYNQIIALYLRTFATGDINTRMKIVTLLHVCLPLDLTKRMEFLLHIFDWTYFGPFRGLTLCIILLMSVFSEPVSIDDFKRGIKLSETPVKFAIHTPRLEGWPDYPRITDELPAKSNTLSTELLKVEEHFLENLAIRTSHNSLISTLYSLMFVSESLAHTILLSFVPALMNHLSDEEQHTLFSGFSRQFSIDVETESLPPILFGSRQTTVSIIMRLLYLCRLQPYTANSPLSMIKGKQDHQPIHDDLGKDLPGFVCRPPRRGLSSHLPFIIQSPFWNLVPFVTDTFLAYHPVTLTHDFSPAIMITSFSLGNLRSRRILIHLLHRLRGWFLSPVQYPVEQMDLDSNFNAIFKRHLTVRKTNELVNNSEEHVASLIDSFDTILKLTSGLIQEVPKKEKESPLPFARHTPTYLSTHLNTIRDAPNMIMNQKQPSDSLTNVPVVSKTWISPLYPYALPHPLWSGAQTDTQQMIHQLSSEPALKKNRSLFQVYFYDRNTSSGRAESRILSGSDLLSSVISAERQLKDLHLPKSESLGPPSSFTLPAQPHSQDLPVIPSSPALLVPTPVIVRTANDFFLQESVIAYLQLSIAEIQANERTFRRNGEARVPISSHHISDPHYTQLSMSKSGIRVPIVMKSGFERRVDQYRSYHLSQFEKREHVDIQSLYDLSDEQIWGPDGKKPDLRCELDCLDGDEWFDGEMDDLSEDEPDFTFEISTSTSTLLFTDFTVTNDLTESPSKSSDSQNQRNAEFLYQLELQPEHYPIPEGADIPRQKADNILFQSLLYPRTSNLSIKPSMAIHEIRIKQFHPPEPFSLMGASYRTSRDFLSEVYTMTNNIGLILTHLRTNASLPAHTRLASFTLHGYHRQYIQEYTHHHQNSLPSEFTRTQYDQVTQPPTRLPKTLHPPMHEGDFYDLNYVPKMEERLSYPFMTISGEIKGILNDMINGPDSAGNPPPALPHPIGEADVYGGALKLLDPAYIPCIPSASEFRVLDMMNTVANKHTMEYSALHDNLLHILRVGPDQSYMQTFSELSWKLGPSQYLASQRTLKGMVDDPAKLSYGPKYLHSLVFSWLSVLMNPGITEKNRTDSLSQIKGLAYMNARWLQHTFSLGSSISYSDLTMYASRYIDMKEFIEFCEQAHHVQPRSQATETVHPAIEEQFLKLASSYLVRPLSFTSQSISWTDSVLFRAYLLDCCLLVDLPEDLRYKAISPLISQTSMFLRRSSHFQDAVSPSLVLGSLPSYFAASRTKLGVNNDTQTNTITATNDTLESLYQYIPSNPPLGDLSKFSEYDRLMLIDIYRHRANFSAAIDTIVPRRIGSRLSKPTIAHSDRFVSHFSFPEQDTDVATAINTIHTIREPSSHFAIGDQSAFFVSLALRASTIALASKDSDGDRLWQKVHLLLGNTTLAHERAFLALEKDPTSWKNWEALSGVLTKALNDKWEEEGSSGYGGRLIGSMNLIRFPPFSLLYSPNEIHLKLGTEMNTSPYNTLYREEICVLNDLYADDAMGSLTLSLFSTFAVHPTSAQTLLPQFLVALQRQLSNNPRVDTQLVNSMKRDTYRDLSPLPKQKRVPTYSWIQHIFYLFNQLPTWSRLLLRGVLLDIVDDFPETAFFVLRSFLFTQNDYRASDEHYLALFKASTQNEKSDLNLSPSDRLKLMSSEGISPLHTLSSKSKSLLSMPVDLIQSFVNQTPLPLNISPTAASTYSYSDGRLLWRTMKSKHGELSQMYEKLVKELSVINLENSHLVVNSIDVLIHFWLSAFHVATAIKSRNGQVESLPEHLLDLAENRHTTETSPLFVLSLEMCHRHVVTLARFICANSSTLPHSYLKFVSHLPFLFSDQPTHAPTASLLIALQYMCSWRDVLCDSCPKSASLYSYSPKLYHLCPDLKVAGVSIPGVNMFLSPSSVSPHSLSVVSDKVADGIGWASQQTEGLADSASIIRTIHDTVMYRQRCSPFSLYLDVASLFAPSEDNQQSCIQNTFVPLTVPLFVPLVTFVSTINSLHTFALYSTWFYSALNTQKVSDYRPSRNSALILPELHSMISIVPSQSSFFLPSLATMVSQPLSNAIARSPTASRALLHVNTQAITGLHPNHAENQFLSKPMQAGSKKDLLSPDDSKKNQHQSNSSKRDQGTTANSAFASLSDFCQPGLVCGGQFSEARHLNRSGQQTSLRATNISSGTVPVTVPLGNDLIATRDLPEGVTMHELMREWGKKIRTKTSIPSSQVKMTDEIEQTLKDLSILSSDQTVESLRSLQELARSEVHSIGLPKNDDVQIRYLLSLRGISLRTLFHQQNTADGMLNPMYQIRTSKQTQITTSEIPICCKEHALHPSLLKAKMRMPQDVLSAAIHRRLPTIEFFQPAMRSMATQMGIGSFITYLCSFTPAHPGALVLYPETGNCVQTVWNWDERWGFGEDEISANEWWTMGVNYPSMREICRPGVSQQQPEKPYSPVRVRCTPSLLRLFGDDILGACYVRSFTHSADSFTDPTIKDTILASLTEFFTIALDSLYRTHPSPPSDIQNTFDSITKACLGELTFKDTLTPAAPEHILPFLKDNEKPLVSPSEILHWTATNLSNVAFSRSLILNTAEQLKRDLLNPVDTSSYLVIHSALHPDYLSQLPWWWCPWF
ncbi:hypothetical protein BLNAU_13150 [Blattamonas nauphoetae]|uniref:Uncharacterized protein n=1 Tax=Blattamonas nauphoetae TaxID=2049346 RepID=A0ABQ9XKA1_9EUKA|nr:hypothetical protein BLNAU_13150 [Blattamonas nauphoetae]